jgi:hypothetical protein
VTPTDWLELGAEQYLRELDEDDFDALMIRARGRRTTAYPASRKNKRRKSSEKIGEN